MRYSEAGLGRIFVLRLEHGDRMPGIIEEFAGEHKTSQPLYSF